MKVNGQQPSQLSELAAGKSQEAGRDIARTRPDRPRALEEPSNRTSLTFNKVRDAIRQEPDVRAGRVQEIRESLKKGDFKISAEKLAENMLVASLKEDLDQA